jgi:hypothetical protein
VIDVNAFIGAYPWRPVPGTGVPDLVASMERVGIAEAWVSHLPSLFWKDPSAGNGELFDLISRQSSLRAVPAVHPGLPHWEADLVEARDRGAVAVRCDPGQFGLAIAGPEMFALLEHAAALALPVLAAVRLEDARGRHPLDLRPDLPPWAVRTWLRASPQVRLIICGADRPFIEEVHWGSTPEESSRVWWDLSWVWGPPEDDLRHLLAAIGTQHFLFGSGQPLRIPEVPVARLDLLDLSAEDRAAITHRNALALLTHESP